MQFGTQVTPGVVSGENDGVVIPPSEKCYSIKPFSGTLIEISHARKSTPEKEFLDVIEMEIFALLNLTNHGI